jgi:hypothetical protein
VPDNPGRIEDGSRPTGARLQRGDPRDPSSARPTGARLQHGGPRDPSSARPTGARLQRGGPRDPSSARNTALAVAIALLLALPAHAQTRSGTDQRADNMRMPNVSIEGERQTPDIFFVFPTGKGGNVSAPRFRDYRPDILDPVVKPWFERDEMVNAPTMQASAGKTFDWDEALKSSPPPAAPPPAAAEAAAPPPPPAAPPMPESRPNVSLPPPSIPSQALSLPRTTSPQPPQPQPPPPAAPPPPPQERPVYPSSARPASPPPPPPSQPSSESVPILVPPQ